MCHAGDAMDAYIRIKFKGIHGKLQTGSTITATTYSVTGRPETESDRFVADDEFNVFKIQPVMDGTEALITLYSDSKERKLGSTRISEKDEWHTFSPSVESGNSILAELNDVLVPENTDELVVDVVLSHLISDDWHDM